MDEKIIKKIMMIADFEENYDGDDVVLQYSNDKYSIDIQEIEGVFVLYLCHNWDDVSETKQYKTVNGLVNKLKKILGCE